MTNSVSSDPDNSTSIDYCINKAIPDGSNLYYATTFESPNNKTIIITLHAFLYELSEIIQECSDPGVARIKLKWWQEEIERLFNNQARHPVTRQLQECIELDNPDLKSTFNSVIDFFNHFIFIEQTDSLETILSLYKSTTGKIWYQCCQLLEPDKNVPIDLIQETGALIHFISCLQQPHTYINDSRCIIPSSYIQYSELLSLRAESINNSMDQKEAFSPLLLKLKNKLDHSYQELKTKNQTSLKHVLILNRIAYKTCEEILRDGCNLLDKNISLTPLRKLWIAWKINTFS